MKRSAIVTVLVLVGAGLMPGTAHAKREFPPDIANHLSASVVPACSICHLEGKTSGVTAVTPFALALRAHSFASSTQSLNTALDQMAADGTDSDGDGVSDVDELLAGTDPNSPVPGATTADPSYGCSVAAQPYPRGWAVAGLAITGILWRRRRRNRSRPA